MDWDYTCNLISAMNISSSLLVCWHTMLTYIHVSLFLITKYIGYQGRNYHWFPGKKEKRDHDSFNIFQKSKRQVFKLAIYQVVSPFFWGEGGIHELFPEFGFVNVDPAGSVLAFSILDLLRCNGLVMLHIHRNDTVGQFNPEAVLKR